MSNQVECPACGKIIAVKGIPKHTGGCPEWDSRIGVPPSEFNFDRHYGRGLYAPGLVDGQDYVECRLCPDVRRKRLVDHLKTFHGITKQEYLIQFPEAPTSCHRTAEDRQRTVRARYGVDNVFQAEETKQKARETVRARYGVDHTSRAPEVAARRAATNLERYGHENPFGSPDVQEKIRQTHLRERGVANPSQDPVVIAKRMKTNRERYGSSHYVETDAFKENFIATSRKRWGTDHPMQSDKGRAHHAEAMIASLGVDNPLKDPSIWQKSYQTNLANHGGQHSQKDPSVLAKARATWIEKYGVDNPSKLDEVKAKIKAVWMAKYGVPFPPQSLWLNRKHPLPNKLEQQVDALSPANVVYTGDAAYWVHQPGRDRNPDFVVLTRDQMKAYQGGADIKTIRSTAALEVLGDYWHGPKFTGKSRGTHKALMINHYAASGMLCLVLWEHDIRKNPKAIALRIKRFLHRWAKGAYPKDDFDYIADMFGV